MCTRHSIRLDRLIELVSQRIRDYIGAYYHLEELELPPPKDDHREALLQEQKTLSAQLEKRSMALKNLYLDKVSGVLSEGQFVELNQDFLEEKSRLERRLAQIDQELSGQEQPRNQEEVMAKARELLELKTLPRELAVMLIEKIEIGEQDQETGRQEGPPPKPSGSGFGGERSRAGMSALSQQGGSEGYEGRGDEVS